jgi:hypothetical protein
MTMKMASMGKKFRLAVIVPLSLFMALLATGGPGSAGTSKMVFCPRAVVETTIMDAGGSVNNIDKLAIDLYFPCFSFAPSAFCVASFRYDARIEPCSLSTLIPARASPSFS